VRARPSAAFRIVKVQYDSPGSDSGSNSSLNAEWVKIKNNGSKGKTLDGWSLRDKAGHVYHFGNFKLKPDVKSQFTQAPALTQTNISIRTKEGQQGRGQVQVGRRRQSQPSCDLGFGDQLKPPLHQRG
jgi:hypothetical protein